MWKRLHKKYRYSLILLRELVRTDFKVKYQDSILGYIWSVLKPLFMFAILYVVFVKILRVGNDIKHWPIALLTGVVLWQFFTDVTGGTLKSIVNNGGLIRKIKFPRYIIVVANTFSALITLAINSVVIIIFAILNHVDLTWNVLLILPFVLELFIFALGVAFFLSATFVKFRDIQYIWDIISQALFYASAIIFPISLIENIGHGIGSIFVYVALATPAAQVIQDVRHLAISSDVPSLWTISGGDWLLYLIPLSLAVFTFLLGGLYFRKRSPYFAEDV
jgi:ABC-2 type transport system permease protein